MAWCGSGRSFCTGAVLATVPRVRPPDFLKLAEAYGAHGIRCADPTRLDAAIEQIIHSPKAVIFDCLVDQKENCFPMISVGEGATARIMADLEDDAGIEIGNVIDEKGKMLV